MDLTAEILPRGPLLLGSVASPGDFRSTGSEKWTMLGSSVDAIGAADEEGR